MNRIAESVEISQVPPALVRNQTDAFSREQAPDATPYNYGVQPADRVQTDSKTTQSVCPCCGTALKNQQIRVDLNTNTFLFREHSVPLTRQQTEIMDVLVKAAPGVASFEALAFGVWGSQEPDDLRNSLKVVITNMRRKLAPRGVPVAIVAVQGAGYRLVLA
jgi:DNA-binding response OmpR family regulator